MTVLTVALKDLRLFVRDARFAATLRPLQRGPRPHSQRRIRAHLQDPAREAAATIWAALFFAGVLGLTRSQDLESSWGAADAVRLAGPDPYAVYLGKMIAGVIPLGAVFLLLLPLTAIFYDVGNLRVLPALVGVVALALLGYSAWGTLFAALARGLQARELLLSVLLFPSLIPLWIGAVKLTHALWAGGSIEPVRDWLKVMAVMDVLGLALSAWLYESVQEAGE